MDVERPGAGRHAAAIAQVALQGLDQARAAAAIVFAQLADRLPVTVLGRIGTSNGETVQYSVDIFLSGGLDLHVVRGMDERPPVPTIGRGRNLAGNGAQ